MYYTPQPHAVYQPSTRTWRIMPQNYMLLGIMHDKVGRPRLYTDHAIDRQLVDNLATCMPQVIHKIVSHVLDTRQAVS